MTDRENVVRLPRRPVEQQSEALRPYYVSQLEGVELPKPEWIVDGVLLRGTVVILAGSPGVGKSLLLQQLLTSVAIGADFLGRETVQSRAFGLFCEDPHYQLQTRQMDLLRYYDRAPADMEANLSFQSRDGMDAVMVEFENFSTRPKYTSLWHDLWVLCEEDGINLVGIDTAATVYSGPDSRNQVTVFIRELQRRAIQINGCIVLNVHPPKTNPNSFGGVTAWLASARAGLSLGRPTDFDFETGEPANVRVLRNLKNNYGAGISAERIEYQDGAFVSTDLALNRKRGPLTHIERQHLKYRLLTGAKRIMMKGVRIPADELDRNSLPARAKNLTDPSINRIPLNDLYLAYNELIDSGQLVIVDVGGRCFVRPHDGPYLQDESPYVMPPAPGAKP
jgi:hypothetical protein